ncbi:MAG: PilZ domain-containing protein [Candidatus Omnitrophica bacterium]|nr:PilZ domain-containing protein [Candidatus Omnitrophota bacterium]
MERRLFERVSVPIKLQYEVKNRPKLTEESTSRNISGGGICLALSEKLLPKTELIMKIDIGKDKNTISIDGRVSWNRRVEIAGDSGPVVYYDTGIEFNNTDPININKIITHFYGKSF